MVCNALVAGGRLLGAEQQQQPAAALLLTADHHTTGVQQGSILGPLLYVLYISDLPITRETTLGTFADDTAILATLEEPTIASPKLHEHLHIVEKWLNKWKIKLSESKVIAYKVHPPERQLPCS